MGSGEDDSRIRNHLRAWREFRGMTQTQLAAKVGTQGSVISLLESGDRRLSDKWLHRLAPVLGIRAGHLLDYDPEQADLSLMDALSLIPEAQRPDVLASIARQVALGEGAGEDPASTHGKVVKFQKPKRQKDKGPLPHTKKNC
jgi:transcriptional regulator with XRE-family HTH domain